MICIKKMVLTPVDLKEILYEISLSHEEALELIKLIDLNIEDWGFTEEAYDYFASQMDNFNSEGE